MYVYQLQCRLKRLSPNYLLARRDLGLNLFGLYCIFEKYYKAVAYKCSKDRFRGKMVKKSKSEPERTHSKKSF